jgi:hypothetical protein
MLDVHSWIREQRLDSSRWLILGKGPSFARFEPGLANDYSLLTLNHAVRQVPGAVAHMIDLDVVADCADSLLCSARAVVMPWIPHVRNAPGSRTLEQLADEHAVLRTLREAGRLLWYNLESAPAHAHREGVPVVPTRFFSAEAGVGLLAISGVKHIRTLGIDGGAQYANTFSDLSDKTLLANGRSSFDSQFAGIARAVLKWGLDFGPLGEEVPVRVYVATEDGQMLATRVLEYSIRRRASISVEVHPLHQFGITVPEPMALENRPRTPFSFQRFLVPQAAGHRGRAIYMDSDMQVMSDIRSLWQLPMGEHQLLAVGEPTKTGRKPQFSVMLLDCERLGWDIRRIVADLDSGALTYGGLMHEMKIASSWSAEIPPNWNCLERFDQDTALLHYTDMDRQPWIATNNPLARLWVKELRSAIADGFISHDYVVEQVNAGFARPSLLWQLEHDLDDPLLLPSKAKQLDAQYVPPYMGLNTRGLGSPWRGAIPLARAWVRRGLEISGISAVSAAVKRRLIR